MFTLHVNGRWKEPVKFLKKATKPETTVQDNVSRCQLPAVFVATESSKPKDDFKPRKIVFRA